MAHSNVPKFGNWENEENDVPYTVYFDKARKNKGVKMINPNDPQENPDMLHSFAPSPPPPAPVSASTSNPRTRPEKPIGSGAVGPTPARRMSREEGDYRKFTNSPARSENLGKKTANESTQQNYGGRGMRYGLDRSPLHPHYQAKIVEGASGSPAQEGKNSFDSSHGNPGKSRPKPVIRGAESVAEDDLLGKRTSNDPDRGAAVPIFGDWNEKDPQSAESYTGIFNKVRQEKHTGSGNVSTTPKHPTYGAQNHQSEEKPKKCCFPWW